MSPQSPSQPEDLSPSPRFTLSPASDGGYRLRDQSPTTIVDHTVSRLELEDLHALIEDTLAAAGAPTAPTAVPAVEPDAEAPETPDVAENSEPVTPSARAAAPLTTPNPADLHALRPVSPIYSTATNDRSSSSSSAVDLELHAGNVRLLSAARRHMHLLGLDESGVALIVNDAEDQWFDETGEKEVFLRGHAGVVLGLEDETVLSVVSRDNALRRRPHRSTGTPRAHGRGVGTRWPTSVDELIGLLRERGARVTQVSSGHYDVEKGARRATLVNTPSDNRSLRNNIRVLQKRLGMDLRRGSAR